MNCFSLGRTAFGIGAAIAILAGCAGQAGVPSGGTPSGRVPPVRRAASSQDLLYVDDSGVDYSRSYVLGFTYPQGKHVATLTGFHRLAGECSDAGGDVFVVAPGEESSNPTTVYEFAHGGSTPIATLSEPGLGLGCAIDPTTGNLAVANPYDGSNPYTKGYGDVAIFAGAQGNPTMYYSSQFPAFYYCGYDDEGDLYLSVSSGSDGYELASLAAGSSSSIEPVNVNTPLYGGYAFAPSVQWDGKHMTVSSTLKEGREERESSPINVYRLSISGSTATVIGTTKLSAPQNRHRGESWIQGNAIVGINYYHGRPQITFWPYPKGGNPSREITHSQNPPGSLFVGVTVSVGSSR